MKKKTFSIIFYNESRRYNGFIDVKNVPKMGGGGVALLNEKRGPATERWWE